jgi:phosphoenolpyruvate synthase/pyruvate phosphate dikinase
MESSMSYIKTFEQIGKNDLNLVGGKGLSLALMLKQDIPVPEGFVITTRAYQNFINNNTIIEEVWNELLSAFTNLNSKTVAVRSSAVTEDSSDTSWAGQFESYLNVDRDSLKEAVEKCFKSMTSAKAVSYARNKNLLKSNLMAVVVQKMINSDKSGVIFTINPINKNPNELMMEGIYGLGELLVGGLINPYNLVLDRSTLAIKSSIMSDQKEMLVNAKDGVNKIQLAEDLKETELLSQDKLHQLANLALKIEEIYDLPQDIEWAIESNKIHILQSRPITTL